MSTTRIIILAALLVVISAAGIGAGLYIAFATPQWGIPVHMPSGPDAIGDGIYRTYDPEMGVACYSSRSDTLSCVHVGPANSLP